MRYEVVIGERTVNADVAPDGSLLVDDRAVAVLTTPIGTDAWAVRVDGSAHEVRILSRDPLRLWVDGDELPGSVADQRSLAAQRDTGRARTGRHELRAPMPGLVKRVHVAEGDVVEQGAPLVTLEAMKMENELSAAVAGRVTRVAASAGTKVEGGALLVVIAQ